MSDQSDLDQPDQSSVGWQIACWVVLLLGALAGLIYFHYRPDGGALAGTIAETNRAGVIWMLDAAVVVALLALFWIINRQTRRRSEFHLHRARRAERAVHRLLEEIRIACGAADDAEHPIARWQAGNAAQTAEITRTAGELSAMAEAIGQINQAAFQATEQAQLGLETAEKGTAAVRNAIAGINDTRSRIQDAADRLKRLTQSTRRFNETVHLIRDVTAQTSVLSLNASLCRGAGEAEAAEEMQRLADRAARGAGEIAELVRAIQSDADGVIASLEITAGKAAAGTAPADEAGRALAEIESASRALGERMERAASAAAGEAVHAQTVGETMDRLKLAAEQSDANVAQVVAGIETLKTAADDMAQSTAASAHPANSPPH